MDCRLTVRPPCAVAYPNILLAVLRTIASLLQWFNPPGDLLANADQIVDAADMDDSDRGESISLAQEGSSTLGYSFYGIEDNIAPSLQ